MFKQTFQPSEITNLDLTIQKKPLKLKKFINSFSLIYGVNQKRLKPLIKLMGIQPQTHINDLTENQLQQIKFFFEHTDSKYQLKDYYREKYLAIKNLITMKCYKGIRHQKHLPVNGQRTHSNSKTCKREYVVIQDLQLHTNNKKLQHPLKLKSKVRPKTKKIK